MAGPEKPGLISLKGVTSRKRWPWRCTVLHHPLEDRGRHLLRQEELSAGGPQLPDLSAASGSPDGVGARRRLLPLIGASDEAEGIGQPCTSGLETALQHSGLPPLNSGHRNPAVPVHADPKDSRAS